MRFFKNRIVISLLVILGAVYLWEFHVKPLSGPIYVQAVNEYKHQNYPRSLELLTYVYNSIDANDVNILTLMGWNYLKLGKPDRAEYYFRRAHRLGPGVADASLGYAYTEIALQKYESAADLLRTAMQQGPDNADVHAAWATMYRDAGRNSDAAREFRIALDLDKNNVEALKNLQEIYNVKDDPRQMNLEYQPLVRPQSLTYFARTRGERLEWLAGGQWSPAYLAGVNLSAALPGHFAAEAPTDAALYANWLRQISDLGSNTLRVYTILPPAFYRALFEFNNKPGHQPLHLVQGIFLDNPPENDFFNHPYYAACQNEIREVIDTIHGQGDVRPTHS